MYNWPQYAASTAVDTLGQWAGIPGVPALSSGYTAWPTNQWSQGTQWNASPARTLVRQPPRRESRRELMVQTVKSMLTSIFEKVLGELRIEAPQVSVPVQQRVSARRLPSVPRPRAQPAVLVPRAPVPPPPPVYLDQPPTVVAASSQGHTEFGDSPQPLPRILSSSSESSDTDLKIPIPEHSSGSGTLVTPASFEQPIAWPESPAPEMLIHCKCPDCGKLFDMKR